MLHRLNMYGTLPGSFIIDFEMGIGIVSPSNTQNLYAARMVLSFISDYEIMKELVQTCQADHSECRSVPKDRPSMPLGFQAVDCNLRCPIALSDHAEYTALSYVWGEGSTTKGLEDLPLTVSDAMIVTLAMGFDYLCRMILISFIDMWLTLTIGVGRLVGV